MIRIISEFLAFLTIIMTAVIVWFVVPARADGLDDLFAAPAAQVAPLDQALADCTGNKKLGSVARLDKALQCVQEHPQAGKFDISDKRYLVRMKQAALAIHNGGDYQTEMLAAEEWRMAQLDTDRRQDMALAEQRRLTTTVSAIPVQQAWWANTLEGLNHTDNWQPSWHYVGGHR